MGEFNLEVGGGVLFWGLEGKLSLKGGRGSYLEGEGGEAILKEREGSLS